MKNLFIFILLAGQLGTAYPRDKVLEVRYFKDIFGHIHRNPSKYSSSMTTLSCGFPVKVLKKDKVGKGWFYVKVGAHKGYIKEFFLVKKRPQCIQKKYPQFFLDLNLDITQMHFWGRLYDQYVMGKSEVQ